MAGPKFTTGTVNLNARGSLRRGSRVGLAITTIDAGDTIGANILSRYHSAAVARDERGSTSLLAAGVEDYLNSGPGSVLAIAVGALAGSPFTETHGAGTAVNDSGDVGAGGAFDTSDGPITSITAASRDGTNILAGVKFTSKDPLTLTPAAAELYVNPETGAWKLGTSTTGAGAGLVVTFTSHDWDAAMLAAQVKDHEVVFPAGLNFKAQNWGIYQKLLSLAATYDKLVVGATDFGATPTTLTATDFSVLDLGDQPRLNLAAFEEGTGDPVSAWAGHRVADFINGTSLEQPAPAGITVTGGYDSQLCGDRVDPVSGTFAFLGVNCNFEEDGAFFMNDDRARVAYSDFERFWSTRRSIRHVDAIIEGQLLDARRASSVAIPMNAEGLEIIRGIIQSALNRLQGEGIVDAGFEVSMPLFEDIVAADRAARLVPDATYSYRLPGQVHFIERIANVSI